MVKNFFTSLCIFLGILDWVVFGRSLGDTCQSCALGKIQIPHIFIKILTGSSLYTVCTCTKVDGIQVILKNHVLVADLFLNLNGKELLLKLTCKSLHLCRFVGPVGENVVLQKLLGNGTCTLGKASGSKCFHTSTKNTSYINSVMLIKTLILDSHYCMLQILRNLVNGNRKSVGIRCCQFTDLITIAVIEESGITKRHDIHFIYVRRICKYSTNGTDSKTGHCNAQGDQADEKDSDKRNMCPFSHHGRAGNKRIPFLRGRFFSVVHDKPPL